MLGVFIIWGMDRVSIPYRYPTNTNFIFFMLLCLDMKSEIRKVGRNSQGTYYITIPKELMKELKFKEKQKVVIKKRGKAILIEDWSK